MNTYNRPWYKNHILLLIIAIPLATVCGSMYTIYLAVSSKEAPVLPDYYKTGLSPQKRDMGHTAITATLDIDGGTITLERATVHRAADLQPATCQQSRIRSEPHPDGDCAESLPAAACRPRHAETGDMVPHPCSRRQ